MCNCRDLVDQDQVLHYQDLSLARLNQKLKQETDVKRKTINPEYNAFLKVHLVCMLLHYFITVFVLF